MTILDANVLLYGYNRDAPQHHAASSWLRKLIASDETIGLPWMTLWAFVRISTNPRIWDNPLDAAGAFRIVRDWTSQPGVVVVHPGPRHAEILEAVVSVNNATGSLVSDAVLVAMAMEYGATLASSDQDFRRFPELRWVDPLRD